MKRITEERTKVEKEHEETNKKWLANVQALNNHVEELDAARAQLKVATDKIAQLEHDMAARDTEIADLHADIAKLEAQLAGRTEDTDALSAANADARRLRKQLSDVEKVKTKLEADKETLARTVAGLEAQITKMTIALGDTVSIGKKRIRDLKAAISLNTQRRISAAELLQKLKQKDYHAIRDAVKAHARRERKPFSTAAAFLHLESMGATWYNYDKFLKQEHRPDTDLKLILEQMLYDLTLWYSMENSKHVHTRYANAHVRAFIAAFGLAHNEPVYHDISPAPSTDDEARPPSPPADW